MQKVLISNDKIDISKSIDIISKSKCLFEKFIISNKTLINLHEMNIPNQHRKQVDKILLTFNNHLLLKANDEAISYFIREGNHIYYIKGEL